MKAFTLVLVTAVVVVIAIFVVRGVEAHQQARADQAQHAANCQQYDAARASTGGAVPTTSGFEINPDNC